MRCFRHCAAVTAACVLGAGCGGGSDDPERPPAAPQKLELKRNRHGGLYLGVRCRQPNSVSCDRVGLAVWLAKPAECLVAKIEGRRLELVSPGEFVPGKGTGWEGYLQPAGLLDPGGPLAVVREPGRPHDFWSGVEPVTATIRLTAMYVDGTSATKTIRAPLHPGWG
jgi:hypothetical protein